METVLLTVQPIVEKTRGNVLTQSMIRDVTPLTLVSQCSQLAMTPAFSVTTLANLNVDLMKCSVRVQLTILDVSKQELVNP